MSGAEELAGPAAAPLIARRMIDSLEDRTPKRTAATRSESATRNIIPITRTKKNEARATMPDDTVKG